MAKTVLIVEDNELNMKLFRDLLEAHGYQTSGTSNGFAGRVCARMNHAGTGLVTPRVCLHAACDDAVCAKHLIA